MRTAQFRHPSDALFEATPVLPLIPACEHFAGNARMILKALALQADFAGRFDLTCDCEDGASLGQESAHVHQVAQLLAQHSNTPGRRGVRIHDVSHPHWRTDVEVLMGEAGSSIDYVTLPKAGSVAEVDRMICFIERRSAAASVAMPRIHVLIETLDALNDAPMIAALPGVETLDFGIMDFVSAHHGALSFEAMHSPLQFTHPLLMRAKADLVAAALACGVVPAHNVSQALNDPQEVERDARLAREQFGFLRMWSIHPSQIEPILRAMSPTDAAVRHAGEILLAAQARDWGPINHDGVLHDRASYRHCWTVLQRARAAGLPIPQTVSAAFFLDSAEA